MSEETRKFSGFMNAARSACSTLIRRSSPYWLTFLVAFGPLVIWTSISIWWICFAGIVSVIFGLVLVNDFKYNGYHFVFSGILIFLCLFVAGAKTFSRSAVIYHPADEPAVVEARGQTSFYPWWRMTERTIYRDAKLAGDTVVQAESMFLNADEVPINIRVNIHYRIPDAALLALHQNGQRVNFLAEIEQRLRVALLRAIEQKPDSLVKEIQAQFQRLTEDLGQPLTSIETIMTVEH